MTSKTFGALALMLFAATAGAQDAKTVIGNSSKAMGVDNLTSVSYFGVATAFNLGQNSNANYPWPRQNQNDYVRAIDFAQPASRATANPMGKPNNSKSPVSLWHDSRCERYKREKYGCGNGYRRNPSFF